MTFEEILDQAIAMLQRHGRVAYRTLKRQFELDDVALEDLKEALLFTYPQVVDEAGRGLVWPATPADQPAPVALPSAASQPPDAERRQLTVMFCDLADSTRLASRLDPEDLREVVRAYQETSAGVIQRFDGYIAQYLGDGLLVYFGFPQAHEDDAQRAVRAGLGILEAIGKLNTRLERDKGVRLTVRIGIHTGPVVVGEMGGGGRHEQLALGETPNIASRIQGIAESNTVAISDATLRLVEGYFTHADLRLHTLKGVETPLRVFRIMGESGAQTRLEVVTTKGLTPLVGREHEVEMLLDRWAQAKEGRGQVVLLSGEAGIGKSRLLQVLKDQAAGDAHTRLECRSSPYYQNTALYPVAALWERVWAFTRDDAPPAKLAKMEQALSQYRLDMAEAVTLLTALLALPLPDDRYAPLTLSPQRQRQKTLDTLLAMVVELAEQQPLLFIVEDLHWVDPSTIEWLTLLLDQTPTSRLCLLLTCRPTFQPPWGSRSYLTQLTLNRLIQHQAEQMVERITGGKILPAEMVRHLVEKADGVPLYIEEMTKAILESGLLQDVNGRYELVGSFSSVAIPTTLQDSLMARLDRLGPAKGVAQMGATIGRQFAYELLQAVLPLDEETLQSELAQLVDAELVYQRGIPPRATYLFKHALIQDTAYQSLLRSTRQQYHQRIARVLEAHFPETMATQPELVAQHYTEAALPAQAIPYWQRAGQQAAQRSAHQEAIGHLTKGMEVLQTLPDTAARRHQELSLYVALGPSLLITRGEEAPEVEQAYGRAYALCQQVEDTASLLPVLAGLQRFYMVRAAHQRCLELGERLLSLAERLQDQAFLLEAHGGLSATRHSLGHFGAARIHHEQVIARYVPQPSRSVGISQDLNVSCLAGAARTLWCLGYPDQALIRNQEAMAFAQRLAHPYSLVWSQHFMADLHQYRGESQAALQMAEASLALATAQGFQAWMVRNWLVRGLVLAGLGRREEGIAQMQQGLEAQRTTGAIRAQAYFLTRLAEVYLHTGQLAAGLACLPEALGLIEATGERWWEAEYHRVHGELLLVQARPRAPGPMALPEHAEVESCFHHALALARDQEAKSLELRAAMSLSRFWQQQGKRAEARQLLAEVYDWFTEGFDTADLQEAKALLETLGA